MQRELQPISLQTRHILLLFLINKAPKSTLLEIKIVNAVITTPIEIEKAETKKIRKKTLITLALAFRARGSEKLGALGRGIKRNMVRLHVPA